MEVRKLVYMVHPTAPSESLEDMARRYFVHSVRDELLRTTLLLTKFTSTKEDLAKALALETAFKTSLELSAEANVKCAVRRQKQLDKANHNRMSNLLPLQKPEHMKWECRVVYFQQMRYGRRKRYTTLGIRTTAGLNTLKIAAGVVSLWRILFKDSEERKQST